MPAGVRLLNAANKATYANKEAPKVAPSRLKSEDYHFEQDGLIYHDTYFGGRDFIGGEIVYESEKPVWGANYFGFVLDENISEKDVYDFLRSALMQEYDDVIPVRALGGRGKHNTNFVSCHSFLIKWYGKILFLEPHFFAETHSSEGAAGGGGWGEESRRARASRRSEAEAGQFPSKKVRAKCNISPQ